MAVDRLCLRGDIAKEGDTPGKAKRCAELCTGGTDVLLVNQAIKLNTMQADGLLGLSPSGSEHILTDLKQNGQIKNRVFSFSLDQKVFTLGGYDLSRFA